MDKDIELYKRYNAALLWHLSKYSTKSIFDNNYSKQILFFSELEPKLLHTLKVIEKFKNKIPLAKTYEHLHSSLFEDKIFSTSYLTLLKEIVNINEEVSGIEDALYVHKDNKQKSKKYVDLEKKILFKQKQISTVLLSELNNCNVLKNKKLSKLFSTNLKKILSKLKLPSSFVKKTILISMLLLQLSNLTFASTGIEKNPFTDDVKKEHRILELQKKLLNYTSELNSTFEIRNTPYVSEPKEGDFRQHTGLMTDLGFNEKDNLTNLFNEVRIYLEDNNILKISELQKINNWDYKTTKTQIISLIKEKFPSKDFNIKVIDHKDIARQIRSKLAWQGEEINDAKIEQEMHNIFKKNLITFEGYAEIPNSVINVKSHIETKMLKLNYLESNLAIVEVGLDSSGNIVVEIAKMSVNNISKNMDYTQIQISCKDFPLMEELAKQKFTEYEHMRSLAKK
jgi:hypothetical protein